MRLDPGANEIVVCHERPLNDANLTSRILSLARDRDAAPCLRFVRCGEPCELSWASFGEEESSTPCFLSPLSRSRAHQRN